MLHYATIFENIYKYWKELQFQTAGRVGNASMK